MVWLFFTNISRVFIRECDGLAGNAAIVFAICFGCELSLVMHRCVLLGLLPGSPTCRVCQLHERLAPCLVMQLFDLCTSEFASIVSQGAGHLCCLPVCSMTGACHGICCVAQVRFCRHATFEFLAYTLRSTF